MKIRMSKHNTYDGEIIETDVGFNGGTDRLRGEHDIDEFYNKSKDNILEDIDAYNENVNVLEIQLNICGL